jgi:hypothetical protein
LVGVRVSLIVTVRTRTALRSVGVAWAWSLMAAVRVAYARLRRHALIVSGAFRNRRPCGAAAAKRLGTHRGFRTTVRRAACVSNVSSSRVAHAPSLGHGTSTRACGSEPT